MKREFGAYHTCYIIRTTRGGSTIPSLLTPAGMALRRFEVCGHIALE